MHNSLPISYQNSKYWIAYAECWMLNTKHWTPNSVSNTVIFTRITSSNFSFAKNLISFHHNYEVNKLLLRKHIRINVLGMCKEELHVCIEHVQHLQMCDNSFVVRLHGGKRLNASRKMTTFTTFIWSQLIECMIAMCRLFGMTKVISEISQTIRRKRDKSNVQCELLFNFHIRLQMNILLIEYLLPITVPMPAPTPVLMHVRQWLSIRFYELRMNIKSAKRKDAPYNPQNAIDVLENWEKEKQKKQRSWREKNNSTNEQKSILKVESNKCTEYIWTDCKMWDQFDMFVSNICSRSVLCLFYLFARPMSEWGWTKKKHTRKKPWNRWKVENNALLARMKLVKWNVTCTVSIESY